MRGADPFQSRRVAGWLVPRKRYAIDLDGGSMHVTLEHPASPETFEALRSLGQAAVAHMARFGDATASEIGEQQLEQRP